MKYLREFFAWTFAIIGGMMILGSLISSSAWDGKGPWPAHVEAACPIWCLPIGIVLLVAGKSMDK
jgi:hypothetical protein